MRYPYATALHASTPSLTRGSVFRNGPEAAKTKTDRARACEGVVVGKNRRGKAKGDEREAICLAPGRPLPNHSHRWTLPHYSKSSQTNKTKMDNSLIPQGIEIVQKAIAADGEGDFERALALYRDALARFTMGLKYEKNEARKKLVFERVEGYMKRAEELSDYLKKQSELDKGGGSGGGVAAAKKGENGGDDADAEKSKLRGALSSAIVSEKPNISWDDVAGLESAKESLKEVRTHAAVTVPTTSSLSHMCSSRASISITLSLFQSL